MPSVLGSVLVPQWRQEVRRPAKLRVPRDFRSLRRLRKSSETSEVSRVSFHWPLALRDWSRQARRVHGAEASVGRSQPRGSGVPGDEDVHRFGECSRVARPQIAIRPAASKFVGYSPVDVVQPLEYVAGKMCCTLARWTSKFNAPRSASKVAGLGESGDWPPTTRSNTSAGV